MYLKFNNKNVHIDVYSWLRRCTFAVILFYLVVPYRFASHYDYVSRKNFDDVLVPQVTRNISLQLLPACNYDEVLDDNRYSYTQYYRQALLRPEELAQGGEYFPEDCRASYSVAIIVPYRQREQQLHSFLIYMHNYLRNQQIHYRIFLVEQYDQKPFNRAKLFNIGSQIVAEYGFPCMILHDVDLLPLNLGQLYACTESPRHMCSALDWFRYTLPYRGLFGGVVSIRMEIYRAINGMSNLYEGWGGEDDDLYDRLKAHNIDILRFEPAYSEYTMLRHKPEKKNENRVALLRAAAQRFHTDGLNSLKYRERERRIHSLFTHILVET